MTDSTGFFNPINGDDPSWAQHVYWYFGHPESWLMVLIWLFILIVVLRVAFKLFKARRIYWMFFFIAAVVGLIYLYAQLFVRAHGFIVSGDGEQAYFMRIVNWMVVLAGFASACWLIFERVRKTAKDSP